MVYVRMSSSTLSSSSSGKRTCQSLCFCDLQATLRYSNTPRNPRRPFFGCPNYNTKGLPYCKFFKWADGDQYMQLELQERKNELLRKEKEVDERLRDIEKREIKLRKREDEIEKREMVQDGRDEEFLKKELMLFEKEAGLTRSRTLLRLSWAVVVVVCCCLVTW
ncbi:hypothetical protein F2P56_036423 [Juglans regia]|uniref:GRF-type domain-containing protein n=1 Tax=Juglans regia TaxID=51240 RepID=A0A833WCP0_JUGRE|nr:hypothetical protein F2P56_036423 [Juglans regia]